MNAFSRREFVKLMAAGGGGLFLPWGCGTSAPSSSGSFFTAAEQRALARFGDFILPPDQDPGGSALGVVPYLERQLTALDGAVPEIFAGGPFSDRNPFAAADGSVSTNFPPNDFGSFVQLDRVQLATWKLRLFGSAGVPGGGPNDAIIGATVGLRDLFKNGIGQALQASPSAAIETLADAQIIPLWAALPADFTTAFVLAVVETMLSPPEYGGNIGGAGWTIAHFEGDSLPLGYAQYDATTDTLTERADHPVTTANPGSDPDPLDAQTEELIAGLAQGLPGGRKFY